MNKLLMLTAVFAALAVANAGSVDIKVQGNKVAFSPTEDAWQQLVAPLSEAAQDKCCTTCTAPKNKYFSIAHDSGKWLCGETCIRDSFFPIFHIFEKNLTKAASSTATVCANSGYTIYDSTVTHGGGGLYCTLDLYACSKGEGNCEHPPAFTETAKIAASSGRGCGYSCKSNSDCDAPCGVCDDGFCEAQAPAVEQIQTTAVPVKVAPPCHFIEDDDTCNQSKASIDCSMTWEKSGDCDSAGYPVCCSGGYGIELYFAPKTDCNKLVNNRGIHWAKPC